METLIGVGLAAGTTFFVIGMLIGAIWERWRIKKIQESVYNYWDRTRADKVNGKEEDEHTHYYHFTGLDVPDFLRKYED